ncbi:MAG: multicopper oxidase family protein [Gemmatimonadales bacterium]
MARRRIAEALQAVALLAAVAGICVGQSPEGSRPCDPQTPLGPSHDLYCIDLIAAPGARTASGRVELTLPAGPFTVGVTPDGHARYTLIGTVTGLAPGRTYVAWVATPTMESIIKLGVVAQGTFVGEGIAFQKFVVLVTAERNARARTPSTQLVLRGQSPSTRLFPPDQLTFAAGGGGSATPAPHEHDDGGWPMVPMPANLTMLPAEMALRPAVTPYRVPAGDTLPIAQASDPVHLRTGDTLRLDAAPVRGGFAFNGQQPGPRIEVERGSEIVVAFTNHLPDSTAIHWHGIRLENGSDGVPGLTQPAIPPGASFTYRIRFPDAGIYWYHAHVREDIQQELGLYGSILVRSADSALAPADREEFLILDDVLVGAQGPIPPGKESPTHALMGRFGNVFLVNGKRDYRLSASRGAAVRFYFTNAANARTMNLSFTGARMRLVAADAGPFAAPRPVENVVIAPAERYVVDVRFERPGTYALVNRVQGLDHIFGRFFPEVDTLGIVTVSAVAAPRRPSPPPAAVSASPPVLFAALDSLANRAPDKTLILTLQTRNLPFVTERLMQLDSIFFQAVEWSGTMPMMNWASTGEQVRWILRDPESGRENMDIDWQFARDAGGGLKLRLVNERRAFHGMQHPIHLHGQRFLVLAVNGVPLQDRAWKDTVLVPAGSTVDILVDTSNPGHWMLHCHIAEHLSAGMMMHFTVN